MVKQLAVILSFILACTTCRAALPVIKTADGFKTVQAYAGDYQLNDPVITLGEEAAKVTIEWDELGTDRRYLRYRITHCDRTWEPSRLIEDEYMEGFNDIIIDDVSFSLATAIPYVHYRTVFPSPDINITASGNYLIDIFDETEPDEVLVSVPVMVTEQTASAQASLTSRTDRDYNGRLQQLAITLDPRELQVTDPFSDFAIVVTQSGRASRARTLLHPTRLTGHRLVYEHQPELIWNGSNEYRRFETVLAQAPGLHIDRTGYSSGSYYAVLMPDEPRIESQYLYDRTQQGRYFVRELNSTRSDIEADYITTIFTLKTEELPAGYTLWLEGDLTGRQQGHDAVMDYDPESETYRKALLLKQGSYNYAYYVTAPDSSQADSIDGDYYQTANRYTIATYMRRPGDRYDRLVNYTTVQYE